MLTEDKKRILFLCYHNSARSQMAEGFMRELYGDSYNVYSAGIEVSVVDSRAVQVMGEVGIDISGQRSKTSGDYRNIVFDILVTVCDRAKQACPICNTPELANINITNDQPRAKKLLHKSFRDPVDAMGSDEEQLNVFRHVRDEIKDWIKETFAE